MFTCLHYWLFVSVSPQLKKMALLREWPLIPYHEKAVADATITVLSNKDSSLLTFGMTDNSGRFTLGNIPPGEYRLLITHGGLSQFQQNLHDHRSQ
jgi:hypothetical protein